MNKMITEQGFKELVEFFTIYDNDFKFVKDLKLFYYLCKYRPLLAHDIKIIENVPIDKSSNIIKDLSNHLWNIEIVKIVKGKYIDFKKPFALSYKIKYLFLNEIDCSHQEAITIFFNNDYSQFSIFLKKYENRKDKDFKNYFKRFKNLNFPNFNHKYNMLPKDFKKLIDVLEHKKK